MEFQLVLDLLSGDNAWILTIAKFLMAGAMAAPCAILLIKVLTLPGVRVAVGKSCFVAGKWCSFNLTKLFGKYGEPLEDALIDFTDNVALKEFKAGMNSDDPE